MAHQVNVKTTHSCLPIGPQKMGKERHHKILNGPGKWDWMQAFGGRQESDIVEFETEFYPDALTDAWVKVRVAINTLGREDGSGNNWNLWGYVIGTNKKVRGFFSTHSRKGFLFIER